MKKVTLILGLALSLSGCTSSNTDSVSTPDPWPGAGGAGPAYLLVEIDEFTQDSESWLKYQQVAGPTIGAHQGRPLMASADVSRFEGDSPDAWTVGIQFESVKAAEGWYNDPDYATARPHRFQAVQNTNMAILEGLPGTANVNLDELGAFLLATVQDVHDENELRRYHTDLIPLIERHGGTALAVGTPAVELEGDWSEEVTLFVGFPELKNVEAWYADPAYKQVKEVRLASSSGSSLVGVKKFNPADFAPPEQEAADPQE